jgi:hypothetical protein
MTTNRLASSSEGEFQENDLEWFVWHKQRTDYSDRIRRQTRVHGSVIPGLSVDLYEGSGQKPSPRPMCEPPSRRKM